MEIVITLFLGGWLIAASILSVVWLKREFRGFTETEEKR